MWVHYINHGFALYVVELLLEEVKLSTKYVLPFDESLSKKLQKGQMDKKPLPQPDI